MKVNWNAFTNLLISQMKKIPCLFVNKSLEIKLRTVMCIHSLCCGLQVSRQDVKCPEELLVGTNLPVTKTVSTWKCTARKISHDDASVVPLWFKTESETEISFLHIFSSMTSYSFLCLQFHNQVEHLWFIWFQCWKQYQAPLSDWTIGSTFVCGIYFSALY